MPKKKKSEQPTKSEPPKLGRPTKYLPEYCEQLEQHMKEGFSFESFAGRIGVNRDTLYEWEKVHEAFSDAKKIGELGSLWWWEKEGKEGLWSEKAVDDDGKPTFSRTFNTTNWIFQMKNRHKWRDKHDHEITDPQLTERAKIQKMSMDELTKYVKDNLDQDK